jgi:hypothetical protein
MPIAHVLWRVTDNQRFPLVVQLGAVCRACGAAVDVRVRLSDMEHKPSILRCSVCTCPELTVKSARAESLARADHGPAA